MSEAVTSADGTRIAFDRSGSGPPVVLVHGAFTDKTHPTLQEVATALAPWFTVFNYDRRGRGASGDTQPYSVEREIDDLTAVIEAAGGSAMVFGGSSGAALALRAAAGNAAISMLALWEPPFHVDDKAPRLPLDFAAQLQFLVGSGRRGEAVERFMVEAADVPGEALTAMRTAPSWPELEALAHTLAYEAYVMGPGNALPVDVLMSLEQPTLVLNGRNSPAWMTRAGEKVARSVAGALHRSLEGETHNVTSRSLAPELLEFFVTA